MRVSLIALLLSLAFVWRPGTALAFKSEDLKKLLGSGKCAGCNLEKANLSGLDLEGADLSRSKLSSANLVGAKLKGADFQSANLKKAKIEEADLTDAKFGGATWVNGLKCEKGKSYCVTSSIKKLLAKKDCPSCDFSFARLEGKDLSEARLYGANFYHADLSGVDFSKSELFDAKFEKANLSGANLLKSQLFRAEFKGANLKNARIVYSEMRFAVFKEANFDGAIIYKTNFREADFTGASIKNVRLVKVQDDSAVFGAAGPSIHGRFVPLVASPVGVFARKVRLEKDPTALGSNFDRAVWVDGKICKRGSYDYCWIKFTEPKTSR